MKKIMISLAVCLILLGAGKSFAEQFKHERHNLEAGVEVSHFKYVEPDVMSNSGTMNGFAASYAYHNYLMLKTEGKTSYGRVRYKSNSTGTLEHVDDYMMELRLMGGYDLYLSEKTILTPYLGVGYRYLNDDKGGRSTSTGNWGFERESNYYYSPIGIETFTKLENDWFFGIVLEYDLFWKGRQISHFEDGDSRNDIVKNDQEGGHGFRASIKFQKKGNISYVIEPFIRNWNIDDSDTSAATLFNTGVADTNTTIELKNHTTEVGIKLALIF